MTGKVRAIVTTVLELGGMLLLVVAGALALATVSVPGAVALAGVGLIGVSAVIEARSRPRPRRSAHGEDER